MYYNKSKLNVSPKKPPLRESWQCLKLPTHLPKHVRRDYWDGKRQWSQLIEINILGKAKYTAFLFFYCHA